MLTGWPFALAVADPEAARRLGIRSVARLRQWHLDLILLGSLSALAGIVVPERSRLTTAAIGIGSWTNAMAFGVLTVAPAAEKDPIYKAGAGISFAITTTGFVALARDAWRRS